MSRKDKIIRMINKLDDDVSYDRVIYHLGVMKDVEIGLEQADRGDVIEHDELFRQLLSEDEEDASVVVEKGK